jgi:hypothetical protein
MADMDDPWQHVPSLEDAVPRRLKLPEWAIAAILVISIVLLALMPIIIVAIVVVGYAFSRS